MKLTNFIANRLLFYSSFIAFLLFISCNHQTQQQAVAFEEELDSIAEIEEDPQQKKIDKLASAWEYSEKNDEMYGECRFASIMSKNFVMQDIYGKTYANLTIRYTKLDGYDVFVLVSSGSLLCSRHDGTNYVMVKFDEDEPIKYVTTKPEDRSSNMLFIEKSRAFIKRAQNAKKILIQVNLYKEGNPRFSFEPKESLKFDVK